MRIVMKTSDNFKIKVSTDTTSQMNIIVNIKSQNCPNDSQKNNESDVEVRSSHYKIGWI